MGLALRPGAESPPGLSDEARRARIAARSLMIATPVARHPTWQYARGLASTLLTLRELGVPVDFRMVVGNSNVARARNELVAHFLASDCTDLLFVDDDIDFEPQAAIELLSSDKPLTGAAGRMRCDKPNSNAAVWCCRWLPDAQQGLRQDETGAIEVAGIGCGFMLVNRSVFETMIAARPDLSRRAPLDWPEPLRARLYEFFAFGELSEDYAFCQLWRDLGGQVFVRPDIRLGHVGEFTWSGALGEILEDV